MGDSALGRRASGEQARSGATPGEFRRRNSSGLDLYWNSAAIRVSGRARSLIQAPSCATRRSFRPETLRCPTADLSLILCFCPEHRILPRLFPKKGEQDGQPGSA